MYMTGIKVWARVFTSAMKSFWIVPVKDNTTHGLYRLALWEKTSQVCILYETCHESELPGSYCLLHLRSERYQKITYWESAFWIIFRFFIGIDDHHSLSGNWNDFLHFPSHLFNRAEENRVILTHSDVLCLNPSPACRAWIWQNPSISGLQIRKDVLPHTRAHIA